MKRDTVEKSLIDISSAFEVSKTSFLFDMFILPLKNNNITKVGIEQ